MLSLFVTAAAVGLAGAAQAQDRAVVAVTIRVTPYASIDFPQGFNFHLHVPEEKKKGHKEDDKKKGKGHDSHGNGHGYGHDHSYPQVILPVVIPYKVVGNTEATVSAKPSSFLRLKSGSYLGKAVRTSGGNTLGYNIINQFPIPSWASANPNSWELWLASFLGGFASLTGANNQGTRPLGANLALRPRGTFGILYVVSKVSWTADGKDAKEGKYGGSVQLTLTPAQ